MRFLYFDKFHGLARPIVLCEGKTDSVYIKCALKALHVSYPELVKISDQGVEYFIDFFKYSKMNMDLMQFSGGSGDLAALIHHYNDRMKPFLCEGRRFPVIILVDNDNGVDQVFKNAEKKIGKKVDGSDGFYHLTENLYLVALPKKSGQSNVKIEDFFEKSVMAIEVSGKKFNSDDKTFDKNKHYGKHVFAEKVVKPNQKSINFNEFRAILDRLKATIVDYSNKMASS